MGSLAILVATCSSVTTAFAHGKHDPQPPGVIDPLVTHHALLEDELTLNYAGIRSDENDTTLHLAALEAAYALNDDVGFEVFVPFGVALIAGSASGGLGDVELQIPKVSFLHRYGFVMTTYVALELPTGADVLSHGHLVAAPHLATDIGVGDFGLQVNLAAELDTEGNLVGEARASFAWSFEVDAAPRTLVSPLVEIGLELPVAGEEPHTECAIVPGAKLAAGSWHMGLGVLLPLCHDAEEDFQLLVQLGYHVGTE